MSIEGGMTVLAILAIAPASATPWFALFWLGFGFWRRHLGLAFLALVAVIGGFTTAVVLLRAPLLEPVIAMPPGVPVLGWAIVAASFLLSLVADRQLGLRVRSFFPYFEEGGRIDLVTTGAYGIVRHPIYAAGIYYQAGIFLVTGSLAVLAACALLTGGALWFTRREERALRTLLADPGAYDRYRARVPALLPWPRGRAATAPPG
jgi:protein-S-isoprenylcysteine O-methyltransferase Ste14